MVCGLVCQRVRSVAVLAELGERAEHDVGARSRLTTQPISSEHIIGGFEVIGNDDEEVPVAGSGGISSRTPPEQPDLDGLKLVDDAREQ